ncbi:MAG: hypothetical protein ACKOWW_07750 [Flavobacteriales bacterium]
MLPEEGNHIEEEQAKPKSSGAKLYILIFLIYLISMIMLFASC